MNNWSIVFIALGVIILTIIISAVVTTNNVVNKVADKTKLGDVEEAPVGAGANIGNNFTNI